MNHPLKHQVRAFWDAQPCGTGEPTAPRGSREFFEQLAAQRYEREPMIREFAEFSRRKSQRVLEVGCGAGTDSLQFARAGARLTSADLSLESLRLARQHLTTCGVQSKFCESDAERLPFQEGAFDLVYSWGVIHHTPNMPAAIDEIWRVLRPGGELRVMIYHRPSWVTFRLWVKHGLLKGKPCRSFRDVLAHHMESAGTQAFTRAEARQLFSKFTNLKVWTALTPYDRYLMDNQPRWMKALLPVIVNATGDRHGWFLMVAGNKP